MTRNVTCLIVAVTAVCLLCGRGRAAESEKTATLGDINSATTDPPSNFRWMNVANQLYRETYRTKTDPSPDYYDYKDGFLDSDKKPNVIVKYFTDALRLHGTLTAKNLKPNFAYVVKLVGKGGENDTEPFGKKGNEDIGHTGRWWQEEWKNGKWSGGQNLNEKGNGSSPNPNDVLYDTRRNIPDAGSPTKKKYRYTGYLLFDYFITDNDGNADLTFDARSSYHVLWKTSQNHAWTQDKDGPKKDASVDVDLLDPLPDAYPYDQDYPAKTDKVFGEWERLPHGGVQLPQVGSHEYEARFVLQEESFHGTGLAGQWAAAMEANVTFTLVPEPTTLTLLALGGLAMLRRRRR